MSPQASVPAAVTTASRPPARSAARAHGRLGRAGVGQVDLLEREAVRRRDAVEHDGRAARLLDRGGDGGAEPGRAAGDEHGAEGSVSGHGSSDLRGSVVVVERPATYGTTTARPPQSASVAASGSSATA